MNWHFFAWVFVAVFLTLGSGNLTSRPKSFPKLSGRSAIVVRLAFAAAALIFLLYGIWQFAGLLSAMTIVVVELTLWFAGFVAGIYTGEEEESWHSA